LRPRCLEKKKKKVLSGGGGEGRASLAVNPDPQERGYRTEIMKASIGAVKKGGALETAGQDDPYREVKGGSNAWYDIGGDAQVTNGSYEGQEEEKERSHAKKRGEI